MGKQNFQEQYIRFNYKLFIWAIFGAIRNEQYLQDSNAHWNDE